MEKLLFINITVFCTRELLQSSQQRKEWKEQVIPHGGGTEQCVGSETQRAGHTKVTYTMLYVNYSSSFKKSLLVPVQCSSLLSADPRTKK